MNNRRTQSLSMLGAAVTVAALIITACGGSDTDGAPGSVASGLNSAEPPASLTFRPAPWCGVTDGQEADRPTADSLEDGTDFIDDGSTECVAGPARLTRDDIASATPTPFDADQWVVAIRFQDDRLDELTDLLSDCMTQAASCASGRMVIGFGDALLTAPMVNAADSDGSFVISGGFDEARAVEIAAAIHGADVDEAS